MLEHLKNLWNFISGNWIWKLVSLAFAFIIFFAVRQSVSYTHTMQVAIEGESTNSEEAVAVRAFEPETVTITFRGTEAAIRHLASISGLERPRVVVKVAPEIEISSNSVIHPRDVRVVNIMPRKIKAVLDSKAETVLPIAEPVVKGAPAESSVKVKLSQTTAKVRGSRKSLGELVYQKVALSTGILDVSGHAENYQTSLKINPPDTKGGWEIEPQTIAVDVSFIRENISKTFVNKWVNVVQSQRENNQFRAEPSFVKVTVYGKKNQIEVLSEDDIKVYASEYLQYVTGSTLRVNPTVSLPYTNFVDKVIIEPSSVLLIPVSK